MFPNVSATLSPRRVFKSVAPPWCCWNWERVWRLLMVHCSCSSATTPSRTSSTAHKSPRWIPVCCSASVRGSHIRVYLWPSGVHCCNRVLCSAYQRSPFRILLSEFTKFLTKECSLVWPLSSRMISVIMFFHICRNEVIRLWTLDFFISTWNMAFLFTITIILSQSWSCSNTCSSTSGYILITIFLLRDFLWQFFFFPLVITPLSGPLTSLPLISSSTSAQVFQSDLLRFTQPLSTINNLHSTTVCRCIWWGMVAFSIFGGSVGAESHSSGICCIPASFDAVSFFGSRGDTASIFGCMTSLCSSASTYFSFSSSGFAILFIKTKFVTSSGRLTSCFGLSTFIWILWIHFHNFSQKTRAIKHNTIRGKSAHTVGGSSMFCPFLCETGK